MDGKLRVRQVEKAEGNSSPAVHHVFYGDKLVGGLTKFANQKWRNYPWQAWGHRETSEGYYLIVFLGDFGFDDGYMNGALEAVVQFYQSNK